jgi:hypothetical protein
LRNPGIICNADHISNTARKTKIKIRKSEDIRKQQQQQQLGALTGRAGKNALLTRDGGNELGGEERPG